MNEENAVREIKSPLKAIRQFCLDCCGGSPIDVKNCTSQLCVLKAFRFGKNPYTKRELTDEQKESARIRLAEARMAREKNVNLDLNEDFDVDEDLDEEEEK